MSNNATHQLPVRPDLDELQREAQEIAARKNIDLAVAQMELAQDYGAENWTRIVQSCELIDAIWRDDPEIIRDLIQKDPNLLHENAGIRNVNWGPPMSYAANLGRDGIIKMLYEFGARDLETAIDRAVLQGQIDTARMLHEWLGSPVLSADILSGPAYTLSATGTALVLELGARVVNERGERLALVDVVLESDSRKPEAKHEILELYVQHGLNLPDTPVMAFHRGRIDLLEDHLQRDPGLLRRNFTHEEIFPPEFGCHDEVLATQGTPLSGTTLLHLCADYDELDIARWLLERGMDPDLKSAVDEDGFGGYTPLFATVVSQPNYWMNRHQKPHEAPLTQMLLAHGADPNIRASLRKQLHPGYAGRFDAEKMYEYHNVTALGWGRQFHAKAFVSEPALRLIEEHGGVD